MTSHFILQHAKYAKRPTSLPNFNAFAEQVSRISLPPGIKRQRELASDFKEHWKGVINAQGHAFIHRDYGVYFGHTKETL